MNEHLVEDAGGEQFRMTPKGAMVAVEAHLLFEQGMSHAEIEESLGLTSAEGAEPGTSIRILVAIADLSGVYDLPEIQVIMDQMRAIRGQDEII